MLKMWIDDWNILFKNKYVHCGEIVIQIILINLWGKCGNTYSLYVQYIQIYVNAYILPYFYKRHSMYKLCLLLNTTDFDILLNLAKFAIYAFSLRKTLQL